MSSVTTSTLLQQADFFASESLTAMLKRLGYNEYPLITSSFFCIFLLEYGIHYIRWLRLKFSHFNEVLHLRGIKSLHLLVFDTMMNEFHAASLVDVLHPMPLINKRQLCQILLCTTDYFSNYDHQSVFFNFPFYESKKGFAYLKCDGDPKYHGNVSCHDFICCLFIVYEICALFTTVFYTYFLGTPGAVVLTAVTRLKKRTMVMLHDTSVNLFRDTCTLYRLIFLDHFNW